MPKEFTRADQIGSLIQRQLAQIIQRKIKDPRINSDTSSFISVSDVVVSGDLSYAKIYISMLENSDENVKTVLKVLNKAASFIRVQLAHELQTRKVPELQFIYDSSAVYGNRLSRLIDDAISSDEDNPKE